MLVNGVSAWRCFEEGLGFIEIPQPAFETFSEWLAFEKEKNPERHNSWRKSNRQSQPLPPELLRVMNETNPKGNYDDFILNPEMIRERLIEICKPWQEVFDYYHISFSEHLPLSWRVVEAERPYVVRKIQELGRKLEVDIIPVGESVSMAQATSEIWCEQNPEEAEETEA